jgi:penicillin-binding protein 1A
LGRPIAGKTGTSNQAKDTWFIGYSTDIVCATWVGYDDARPLGAREQGATAALPAWIAFMKAAHEKRPATEFPRPAGIVSARIDPKTGLLAYEGEEDAMDEVFLQGTEPQAISVPDAGIPSEAGPNLTSPEDAGATAQELPSETPAPAPAAAAVPAPVPAASDGGLPQLPAEDPPPF